MKKKRVFVCYNAKGMKLGTIEIEISTNDLRSTFLDKKVEIKSKYPGTAFIKPKRAK